MNQKPSKPRPTGSGDRKALKGEVTDAAVRESTERSWDDWFAVLDQWGAKNRPRGEIVRWLVEDQGVDQWWAQTLTVGYEQERGLPAPDQDS
ncbi:hypothetical protein [Spirillospora sp. NPDC047279]|uniref:hypothetical protein n=1 Tax=Spirillospora sp. NPDC047279 TaxID=3155478 RepID=UPI0033CB4A9A